MSIQDLYLLSPEIAMVVVGALVIIVDLVTQSRRAVAITAIFGLLLPLAASFILHGYLQSIAPDATFQATGPFGTLTVSSGQMNGLFGTLVVDKFAVYIKVLVVAVVALVILGSADYVERFERYKAEFYVLLIFSAAGMMLLGAATELVTIYISLELTALPLVALAAFLRNERSSEAGVKFLLLSGMSSALLLYGMVLVYGFAGTTQLDGIADAVAAQVAGGGGLLPFGGYALLMGVVLIVAGFGFKMTLVPFQMWAPDVYEGAPTPVTAYLSVASKTAGFAVTLRVFYLAFGATSSDWSTLFAVLSAMSMTVGNLVAIPQQNIKRLLAYSTIAHAGYMLAGVAATTAAIPGDQVAGLGPSGVLFYLSTYAVTNLAAFFAIMVIASRVDSDQIDAFAGMSRRAPVISAVLALSMISLIGIPPTAGFMGKLYLFNAAVRGDLVWLAVVGVINSVVSAYYYLRVIRVMYMAPGEPGEQVSSSVPVRLALAVTSLGILGLGILPGPLIEVSEAAARSLLPGV